MYDTSVKVPCIVSQPQRIPAGRVSDTLVSGYEVFPTLLEYAGVSHVPAGRKTGRSFRRILEGTATGDDAPIVVYDEYGPVRMVRTRDWKYVHRYPDGPHELFELLANPGERRNAVADVKTAATVAGLRAQLEDWFDAYADPLRDGVDKGVTGCGQLGLVEGATAAQPMFADSHLVGADWDLWVASGNAKAG